MSRIRVNVIGIVSRGCLPSEIRILDLSLSGIASEGLNLRPHLPYAPLSGGVIAQLT